MDNYNKIISWMYINDGKFPSKNKWREEFSKMLNETICDQSLTDLTGGGGTTAYPNFNVPHNTAIPIPYGNSLHLCGTTESPCNCKSSNIYPKLCPIHGVK